MLYRNIIAVLSAAVALTGVNAHNQMTSPKPRDLEYYTGDKNCASDGKNIPGENNFKRGDTFPAVWSWNNHRGGFVRFSIVPLGDESTKDDIFKNPENIIGFYCHEGTCGKIQKFDTANDPELACRRDVPVPDWLKDGEYTLQWALYSGYDSFGDPNRGLVLFRSCANVKISGGNAYKARADNKCGFSFTGGDAKSGDNSGKCSYFSVNYYNGANDPDLDKVSDKNQIKQGVPKEVADCGNNVGAASASKSAVTSDSTTDSTTDSKDTKADDKSTTTDSKDTKTDDKSTTTDSSPVSASSTGSGNDDSSKSTDTKNAGTSTGKGCKKTRRA